MERNHLGLPATYDWPSVSTTVMEEAYWTQPATDHPESPGAYNSVHMRRQVQTVYGPWELVDFSGRPARGEADESLQCWCEKPNPGHVWNPLEGCPSWRVQEPVTA